MKDEERSFVLDLGDAGQLNVSPDRRRPHPINGPGAALEAHLEGLQWLMTDHGSRHFDIIVKYGDSEVPPLRGDRPAVSARAMLVATMNANSTTYVSPEMTALVQALIPDLGPSHFHLMDLPDEAGVILFGGKAIPSSYAKHDVSLGMYVNLRGIVYRIVPKGGVIIDDTVLRINGEPTNLKYQLNAAEPEEDRYSFVNQTIQGGGLIVWPLYDAGDYFVEKGSWEGAGRPPFLPMRSVAIPFGAKPVYDHEQMAEPEQLRDIVVTLFRLMWQRIIAPEPYFPKRAEMRRADRFRGKLPLDGERYKVVHLRRYEGLWQTEPVHRGERGPMRYKVIVRGHPRNQYYPSLGPARNPDGTWNEDSHRTIWIDPHMRGDGVLILKHAVSAIIR
jgi:hypothetical protein